MSDLRATPGPWRVLTPTSSDHNDSVTVEFEMPQPSAFRNGVVASVYGSINGDRDANAYLIASAPNLYEALDRLCKIVSLYGVDEDALLFFMPIAREALARAHGEA